MANRGLPRLEEGTCVTLGLETALQDLLPGAIEALSEVEMGRRAPGKVTVRLDLELELDEGGYKFRVERNMKLPKFKKSGGFAHRSGDTVAVVVQGDQMDAFADGAIPLRRTE